MNEWSGTETAWGWCGFRDGQRGLPDARPMGFPFDRSVAHYWKNRVIITRQGTLEKKGTMHERGNKQFSIILIFFKM